VKPTTAAVEGPEWSARAAGWAQCWARFADPARAAVADATAIAAGTSLLDVGCGTGEFCRLAATRGATVSGIDAAEGMIEIARRQLPDADLRVGPMEDLPWPDDNFDLVTAINALQFAADFVAALGEAGRVARPGGLVAICNWSRIEERELWAVLAPLRELAPPEPDPPGPPTPAVGEPGVLEDLARQAGLDPIRAGDVDVPFEAPDRATLERALLVDAMFLHLPDESRADAVRATIDEAGAPYRRPDGSYRFENRFRYVVAQA